MSNQSLDGFFRLDKLKKHYRYQRFFVDPTEMETKTISFANIARNYEEGISNELLLAVYVPATSFELRIRFNEDKTEEHYASRTFDSMHTRLLEETNYIPALAATFEEDEEFCVFGFISLYADKTTVFKQVQLYSPNTFGYMGSGLWKSTDPINSINLSSDKKLPKGTHAQLLIATQKESK